MTSRAIEELTTIEREVIGELRALRATPRNDLHGILLDDPARLLHHFILIYHGNVQIRLGPVAREIGIEMRTLERKFIAIQQDAPSVPGRRPPIVLAMAAQHISANEDQRDCNHTRLHRSARLQSLLQKTHAAEAPRVGSR